MQVNTVLVLCLGSQVKSGQVRSDMGTFVTELYVCYHEATTAYACLRNLTGSTTTALLSFTTLHRLLLERARPYDGVRDPVPHPSARPLQARGPGQLLSLARNVIRPRC